MNYTYFYKEKYSSPDELSAIGEYDYLIAMFVDSDRVLIPASKIISKKAIWIILENDRDIALTKLPANIIPIFIKQNEDYDCVLKYFVHKIYYQETFVLTLQASKFHIYCS